jgi:hypothetical protein
LGTIEEHKNLVQVSLTLSKPLLSVGALPSQSWKGKKERAQGVKQGKQRAAKKAINPLTDVQGF